MKIRVARLRLPLAQAHGQAPQLTSLFRRQDRIHRRIGGIAGALQHVDRFLHERCGTLGCVVVLHDWNGTRARPRTRPGSLPPYSTLSVRWT